MGLHEGRYGRKVEETVDFLAKRDTLRILKRIYKTMQTRSVRDFRNSRRKKDGKIESVLKGFVWEKACQIVQEEMTILEKQIQLMREGKWMNTQN